MYMCCPRSLAQLPDYPCHVTHPFPKRTCPAATLHPAAFNRKLLATRSTRDRKVNRQMTTGSEQRLHGIQHFIRSTSFCRHKNITCFLSYMKLTRTSNLTKLTYIVHAIPQAAKSPSSRPGQTRQLLILIVHCTIHELDTRSTARNVMRSLHPTPTQSPTV